MSLAGSLLGSLLATLSRPAWWVIGLGAFLVRGGVIVILLPIVALPTVAGLANAFGPALVGFVFGGPSPAFLTAVGAFVVALVAWLIGSGLVGGGLDLALVRDAATDDELEGVPPPRSGGPARALAVRLAAHLPTFAVLGVGAVRLVEASYAELTHPGDPGIPIPVRIALRIPEVVGLLAAAFVLGEAVGGLAVRHLAWGASAGASIGRAIRSLLRPSAVVTLVVTDAVLVGVLVGVAAAVGPAWDQLRVDLVDARPALEIQAALALFTLAWTAGLWLISLAVAWRSTAWTFEVARHRHPDHQPTSTRTARGSFADPPVLAP